MFRLKSLFEAICLGTYIKFRLKYWCLSRNLNVVIPYPYTGPLQACFL